MSYTHLTMDERNIIYRKQWQGYSDTEIARCLGRHRSPIGRERQRNRGYLGFCTPFTAQTLAHSRRRAHLRRPKTGHCRQTPYPLFASMSASKKIAIEKKFFLKNS